MFIFICYAWKFQAIFDISNKHLINYCFRWISITCTWNFLCTIIFHRFPSNRYRYHNGAEFYHPKISSILFSNNLNLYQQLCLPRFSSLAIRFPCKVIDLKISICVVRCNALDNKFIILYICMQSLLSIKLNFIIRFWGILSSFGAYDAYAIEFMYR